MRGHLGPYQAYISFFDFIVHFYIVVIAINEVVKASENTQEYKISLVHFQRSKQESRLQKCTASNVHQER